MQSHRISAGVLVERAGRVLMVRHVKAGVYDFWVAPGGGVQGEESLAEAAQREALEETGVTVAPLQLAYIEELTHPGARYCKFWYAAGYVGGELDVTAPEATQEHIVEAAWLSREDMQGKTIFPTVLHDRYWGDALAGFPHVVPLGLRRMAFW